MSATSATTNPTDVAAVSKEQIVEFQAKLKQTNDLMRVIHEIYSGFKTQDTTEPDGRQYGELYMRREKKMKPFKKAIQRFIDGPIRQLHWLFIGYRYPLSDLEEKFLEHLDTLEKLTPEEMLAGIAERNAPDCFRENSKQIGQYFEKYSHLAPKKNPLHPSIAALCSTAHSIGRLRQVCRKEKIDDSAAKKKRQDLETRILAKLSWWMSATGKQGKEKMSWVAYLEANQLTKMHPDAQSEIADRIEDWLIAMRAIEHAYVLLRKNAEYKYHKNDYAAFVGWQVWDEYGIPSLRVAVNEETCARKINWRAAANGFDVEEDENPGKPKKFGMSICPENRFHVYYLEIR